MRLMRLQAINRRHNWRRFLMRNRPVEPVARWVTCPVSWFPAELITVSWFPAELITVSWFPAELITAS